MGIVYDQAKMFMKKYPGSFAFRIKKHSNVIERHLNPGEKPTFVFVGQKSKNLFNIGSSCAVAVTDRRILIGKKRIFWGYFLSSITPDLYNDMQVYQGLIWGSVTIDTVKEEIVISSISKKGLDEIETRITEFMMQEKKKYQNTDK
ncbi:MAG: PH domain-containing protein [Bacilli bacterium]|nr:PH domain-containing protein [Bacilli bacterium]